MFKELESMLAQLVKHPAPKIGSPGNEIVVSKLRLAKAFASIFAIP